MVYSAVVRHNIIVCALFILPWFLVAQQESADPQESIDDSASGADWIESTDTQPDPNVDWVRPAEPEDHLPPLEAQAAVALRAEAFKLDLDSKTRVLRTLNSMLDGDQISPADPAVTDLVSFLATESYDYQVRREGRLVNDFPSVRAEAVRLLGAIGGPSARATLERVLLREEDAYVLSRAVTAVAHTTTTASAELFATLTGLVTRMNAVRRPDNALAIAVVNAVGEIHDRSIRIDDPDLFRALISIAQGGYSTTVRRAAAEVIDKLREQSTQ